MIYFDKPTIYLRSFRSLLSFSGSKIIVRFGSSKKIVTEASSKLLANTPVSQNPSNSSPSTSFSSNPTSPLTTPDDYKKQPQHSVSENTPSRSNLPEKYKLISKPTWNPGDLSQINKIEKTEEIKDIKEIKNIPFLDKPLFPQEQKTLSFSQPGLSLKNPVGLPFLPGIDKKYLKNSPVSAPVTSPDISSPSHPTSSIHNLYSPTTSLTETLPPQSSLISPPPFIPSSLHNLHTQQNLHNQQNLDYQQNLHNQKNQQFANSQDDFYDDNPQPSLHEKLVAGLSWPVKRNLKGGYGYQVPSGSRGLPSVADHIKVQGSGVVNQKLVYMDIMPAQGPYDLRQGHVGVLYHVNNSVFLRTCTHSSQTPSLDGKILEKNKYVSNQDLENKLKDQFITKETQLTQNEINNSDVQNYVPKNKKCALAIEIETIKDHTDNPPLP